MRRKRTAPQAGMRSVNEREAGERDKQEQSFVGALAQQDFPGGLNDLVFPRDMGRADASGHDGLAVARLPAAVRGDSGAVRRVNGYEGMGKLGKEKPLRQDSLAISSSSISPSPTPAIRTGRMNSRGGEHSYVNRADRQKPSREAIFQTMHNKTRYMLVKKKSGFRSDFFCRE